MLRFLLVRHGVKEAVPGDAPLSSVGRRQAEATAQYLAGRSIQAVYSSPLRRALQTARTIATPHGIGVVEERRLRERANWGDLPGQTVAEFVAMWDRSTRDATYLPPVGDSAREAGARLERWLCEMAMYHHNNPPNGMNELHEPRIVVAVTHGGLITDFLAVAFPAELLDQWHPDFLACQSELVSECSITSVRANVTATEPVDAPPAVHYALEAFAATTHLQRLAAD
jgi:2,3-bisphosphoglycerate-dependent phosphoglycerate mutase